MSKGYAISPTTVKNIENGGILQDVGLIGFRDPHLANLSKLFRSTVPESLTAVETLADDVFAEREDRLEPGSDLKNDPCKWLKVTVRGPKRLTSKSTKAITALMASRAWSINFFKSMLIDLMFDGDQFICYGFNQDNKIIHLYALPTFSVLVIPDEYAKVKGYIQKTGLSGVDSKIDLSIYDVAHFSRYKDGLYGVPMFSACDEIVRKLNKTDLNIDRAEEAIGVNANVHEMPEKASDAYEKDYVKKIKAARRAGVATDYYVQSGGKVTKVSHQNPDIKALVSAYNLRMARIITRARMPAYLFSGLESARSRDSSGQTALVYGRTIVGARSFCEEGFTQIFDAQLLNLGIPIDELYYDFEWADIVKNVYADFADNGHDTPGKSKEDDQKAD